MMSKLLGQKLVALRCPGKDQLDRFLLRVPSVPDDLVATGLNFKVVASLALRQILPLEGFRLPNPAERIDLDHAGDNAFVEA